MKLDYFGYRKKAPGGALPPVAAVVGKEAHLRRLVVSDFIRLALGEHPRDMNLIERDLAGATSDGTAILDDLRTPSLLGGTRVVHLRGIEALDKAGRGWLESYVTSPAPGAFLLLEGETLAANTRLHKAIEKGGMVVACRPLYATPPPWGRSRETEVERWIRLRAGDLGKRIAPAAVTAAVEAWGADLAAIDRALEAASLLAGEASEIGVEPIRSLAPEPRTDPFYRAVDAVLELDRADAMRRLRTLFIHGLAEPTGRSRTDGTGIAHIFIRGLHRKLSQIGSAHRLRAEGRPDPEILSEIGVARFLAEAFWRHVEAHPAGSVPRRLSDVLDAERSIKTGIADPQAAAEALILKVTARG